MASKISGLYLINALTGKTVASLVDGMTIALDEIQGMTSPAFNIKASISGNTAGSVAFGFNSKSKYSIENRAPFTLCGKRNRILQGPVYSKCNNLGIGTHTVDASLYSRRRAQGQVKSSSSATFTIVQTKKTQAPVPFSAPSAALSPVATIPVMPPLEAPVIPPLVVSPVMPPIVTPIKGDTTAPMLLNFTNLTSCAVDVTGASAIVRLQAVVQDIESGFKQVSVLYDGKSVGKISLQSPLIGNSHDVEIPIRQVTKSGVYGLMVVLSDGDADTVTLDSKSLAARSFTSEIRVSNSQGDMTSPKLVDLAALSSTSVDVTSAASATVQLRIKASDVGSGVYKVTLNATSTVPGTNSGTSASVELDSPLTGTATIDVSFPFQRYMTAGEYALQLTLTDAHNNAMTVHS
jgi:hypothetical protein